MEPSCIQSCKHDQKVLFIIINFYIKKIKKNIKGLPYVSLVKIHFRPIVNGFIEIAPANATTIEFPLLIGLSVSKVQMTNSYEYPFPTEDTEFITILPVFGIEEVREP